MIDRCLLIVNPASGTVSKHRIIPHVLRRLERMGLRCDVAPTRRPGHATELARKAVDDGYELVLACGGDGTVNEIATGLCGTSAAMGIIPAGSGNGLARHLGIPVDIDSSLRVIKKQNIIAADYGTANGRPFFCTFGVGFDAAVSERCARQKRRGIMMYLKTTINEYVRFMPEEYIIEANGRVLTEKAFLVVCCNASQYGNNAFVAPQASVTDGELEHHHRSRRQPHHPGHRRCRHAYRLHRKECFGRLLPCLASRDTPQDTGLRAHRRRCRGHGRGNRGEMPSRQAPPPCPYAFHPLRAHTDPRGAFHARRFLFLSPHISAS